MINTSQEKSELTLGDKQNLVKKSCETIGFLLSENVADHQGWLMLSCLSTEK